MKLSQKKNASMEQILIEDNSESDPKEVAYKIYKCATKKTPIQNVSGNDAEAMLQMNKSMSEDELMKKN